MQATVDLHGTLTRPAPFFPHLPLPELPQDESCPMSVSQIALPRPVPLTGPLPQSLPAPLRDPLNALILALYPG